MATKRKRADETKGAETAVDQVHSFSRTMAKEHGEKAAVMLQYLAHHIAKSKHVHGGKKWFYSPLQLLTRHVAP